jgi:hypothetical protein
MGASIAVPSERLRPLISIESVELTGTLRTRSVRKCRPACGCRVSEECFGYRLDYWS